MSYPCEVRDQLAQPTLSVRTRLAVQDLQPTMARVYPAIAQYAAELGEPPEELHTLVAYPLR